ncbi:DUF4376 domain-containing protein [Indiicoccus explosivorum]|uniref:DUF4376 domain-containing protein n=1 Tax=Indiicoccus explosivorum TaxID=1917864 RepID=UPI000B43682A|nr:DUF4376 domain-containing protein [Indiicoccus explosivorum]
MLTYLEYHKDARHVIQIHDTEVAARSGNYLIAKSEVPEHVPGYEYEHTITVHVVNNEGIVTESSSIRNNPQAARLLEENAALKRMNMNDTEKYAKLDKISTPIAELKDARILKLKEECTAAIYAGFTSGTNEFGFNEKDQANFTQQLLLIVSGDTADIRWKTKNNGVQVFTVPEFQQVINDATAHKVTQQEKYWQLEAQVLAATLNAEVDAIIW